MNPAVREIAERVASEFSLPAEKIYPLITSPPEDAMGDYSLPCFILAKELKRSPQELAMQISTKLAGGIIAKAEAAGPYVNIVIDRPQLFSFILSPILHEGSLYGGVKKRDETIVIDFSSPNIARPFSIAHLRSTALGNSLKKIYQHLGYRVIGVNHLGDWGVQFGTLISAYKRWGDDEKIKQDSIYELYRLYVRFNDESERDPSLKDEARGWFKRLEERDPEAFRLWEWFVEISLKAFQHYYKILGVEFEVIQGESAYRDQTAPLIDELIQNKIAEESDGALIIRLNKPGEKEEIPPLILKTHDGTTVYATRDLCAARSHWDQYHFAKKLYVVDAGQSLHFKQLFTALKKMGYEWSERLFHVPFGVMLFEDERMSTRKGRIVFLEEVLNRSMEMTRSIIESIEKMSNLSPEEKESVIPDVGVSAIIYADLSRSRIHDINFRWSEVLNFNGKSGPYIQYTHARMEGVLRKYEENVPKSPDFAKLGQPSEIALAKRLESFPSKVQQAADEYEPFVIAEYLGNLAITINQFYDNCRVLGEEPALEEARIALVYCAKLVLKRGLELLGMRAPERM
jgi:arginyl-tRNA synthetase